MSDFTTGQLEALRRAYAAGVTRVEYDGRVTQYPSAADLLSRIRELERSIGVSAERPRSGFASFSRGD